jgi:DNA-binding MarR family transcriptional regulator
MDQLIQYLRKYLFEQDSYRNSAIGNKESYIVCHITLAHLLNKTLRVSDLFSKQDLGTGPTIQSYITKLVSKEFVVRKSSEEDKRIQYLIPTDNAINLLRELSNTTASKRRDKSKG